MHSILEQRRVDRLSTIRIVPEGGDADDPALDLLFASSGIEDEIVAEAERTAVFDQAVPVARVGHLIALKLLSTADHRRSDEQDLVELLSVVDVPELERTRRAVRLITERGYNRGRDLEAALDQAIRRWRPAPP